MFSIEMLFNVLISEMGERIKPFVFKVKSTIHLPSIFYAIFYQGKLNHITGDVNYLALVLNGSKTILTIHDIGHYEHTLSGWKKKVYRKLWFEWPLKKVAYITTVSEFTKQKLIDTFHLDPSKIKVIYNPIPDHYTPHVLAATSSNFKVLQIGSGINKNIDRLIEAAQGLPCELILLRAYDEVLDRKIKTAGLQVTWYFNLSKEAVHQLYIDSDVIYFASTYEGFGMPIIEAQATGRPVITSNVASMPEVAGDGACIVDPYHVDDIRRGLECVFSNEKYRHELIAKGFENIKRFKVSTIAKAYLDLYAEVIKHKS